MVKNRLNHLRGRFDLRDFDPGSLVIPGELTEWKLQPRKERPDKLVIAIEDNGVTYVVDGRHATRRAQLRGDQTIRGILVEDDYLVGKQKAIDRLCGMLLKEKK